jgi:hypothetical protein
LDPEKSGNPDYSASAGFDQNVLSRLSVPTTNYFWLDSISQERKKYSFSEKRSFKIYHLFF